MLLICCILITIVSSFLLFVIQPLAAKALLPIFGGVPAVWNICLLFFQGMLVFGYFYSHLLTKFFNSTSQRIIHVSLLLLSCCMLPILFEHLYPNIYLTPALNVLWLLVQKLFLPLFIVSTTAPLVQYWFSQSAHPDAQNPYFLYSASNIGSLGALLSFPLLLEPFYGLHVLSNNWSMIYIFFAVVLGISVWQLKSINQNSAMEIVHPVRWQERFQWLLLSFAPSSLLMAVTQYMTTEVIAVPLLWVLPLAIYLLCFIIAFARKPIISHTWMVREQALFLIFPLITLSKTTLTVPAWQLILFHLLGFFALTMVCLGELVKTRPDKSHLTEFYLWIAIGGFLGGIFNGLIAPLIFNGIYEYYFAFCLCLLLRPWPKVKWLWSDLLFPLCIAIVLAANYFIFITHNSVFSDKFAYFKWIDLFVLIAVITVILVQDRRTLRFAMSIAVLFLFSGELPGFAHDDLIWQARNFFGVTRVYKKKEVNLHLLMNGSTLHGMELLTKSMAFNRLTSYYQPLEIISYLMAQTKPQLQIAIAGLGTGVLSCQFRKQDSVTFFEIDPNVVKIAKNPTLFTYQTDCPAKVILGDARLEISKMPAYGFDEIIIDVFSSDAIPSHLFTREAIIGYLQKLTPNGLLLFNISNRHINLTPVLFGIAKQLNLQILWKGSYPNGENFQLPSEWIMLSYNKDMSQLMINQLGWKKVVATSQSVVWSDDFSNIVSLLK